MWGDRLHVTTTWYTQSDDVKKNQRNENQQETNSLGIRSNERELLDGEEEIREMGSICRRILSRQSIIREEEVRSIVQQPTKGKASGVDHIPAQFIQNLSDKGMELITTLSNRIYNSGKRPEDFVRIIFTQIPNVQKADQCSDFRTISLISHTIASDEEKNLSNNRKTNEKGQETQSSVWIRRYVSIE